ncbi:PREDICTED: voltage-dependent L-type calcium channel subunit alpha-1D-like isoform X2 [Amphimedon queenslandica]|nr:PREDICTED: voltage-dependent L-type calcium channel subunit alpha-1D-like isoform X2 [Amphimedon queenslandica]|eukprot:XP_019855146.1 PREDICTED: voltage-dependent L-type calcium channel subunit alpha-1D-like isoform X2 [Amphimedon queenslandica]
MRQFQVSQFPCHDPDYFGGHNCSLATDKPEDAFCENWPEGPHSGLVGFDNIGIGLLTVFQCITLEGWTSILYQYESVYGTSFVWIYFISLISFGSIFMLNLLLGVLTSVFIGVSDHQEVEGHLRVLKKSRKIKEDYDGYNEWMKRGGYCHHGGGANENDDGDVDDDDDQEIDEEFNKHANSEMNNSTCNSTKWGPFLFFNKRLRSVIRHVVKSHVFFWSMIAIISINFMFLSADFYPIDKEWISSLIIINYIFTGIYIIECFLKLYSLGPRRYFTSQFNRIDFLFTLINIIDILALVHISDIYFSVSSIVNACRAIRLISAFKYTRYWKGMRAIISTFAGVGVVILSVMALLLSFIFTASLLGMRMFGTRLFDITHLHPTFNDFVDSFLLVFQLTTTEDWNTIMYRSGLTSDERFTYNIGNFAIIIYYLYIIIIGAFNIVNIFLAIAIDKLSEVKAVNEESTHRLEQREEERKELEEQLNALKDPLQYFKLSQTLRKVLIFYSSNLKEEEELQETRKRRRERSVSEAHVKVDRSVSLPLAEIKRRSFASAHAVSDPGRMTEEEGERREQLKHYLTGMVPQKVSIANPLGKFFKLQHSASSMATASQLNTGVKAMTLELTETTPPTSRADQSKSKKPDIDKDEEEVTDFCRNNSINSLGDCSLELNTPASLVAPPSPLDPPTDASVARLVRKSSLEDIDLIIPPESERSGMANGDKGLAMKPTKFKKIRRAWSIFKEKGSLLLHWLSNYFGSIIIDPRLELKEIPAHSAFFILAPDNRLRVYFYNVVKSKPFQTVTFTIIILSSLLLTLEIPVRSESSLLCGIQGTIFFFDIFCSVWFLLEFILKIISLGAIIHRGSYFHCLFNIIDFFVVVTTIFPLILHLATANLNDDGICLPYSQRLYHEQNSYMYIEVILVFRVLRPLRLWRVEGLFLVTKGLFSSLRRMGYVFFVGTVLLLIFAVIGVQLFKGRFFYCTDFVSHTEEECRGQYFIYPSNDLNCPKVLNREWKKWDLHFDNIGWSFLSIYTMITKEGWQDIMYHAIDSHDVGEGPVYNFSRWALVYHVLFMVLVTFFLINLLVGFVIVTFQQNGIKRYDEANLDRNQRNCLYFSLTSVPRKKYIPQFSFHKRLYSVINSWLWRLVINILVAINVIILSCQYYTNNNTNNMDSPSKLEVTIYWINFGFTILFTLEAVFKIIILTPPHYFRSSERGFEFLLVIGSVLELTLQSVLVRDSNSIWRYSQIASCLRVLRLVQISKNTRLIVWTVLRSLEIFPWVGVLLLAVLFTYAIVGMQVFGRIKPVTIDNSTHNAIHQYNNFANFPQALLVMIRCFTGENWEQIMLGSVNALCVDEVQNQTTTCGSPFTYFFYPSFLLISSILVLNLFVAIIIDNFDYFVRDKAILGSHDLTYFYQLWAKLDPSASGKIHHTELIKLMRSANPPLGWGRLCSQVSCYKRMISLSIPVDEDGMIAFNATLFAIVRVSLKIDSSCGKNNNNNYNSRSADLRLKLQSVFPNCPKKILDIVLPERPVRTTSEEYAALFIQQFWRRWKLKVEKQREGKPQPHQQRMSNVLRRVPDMGPTLLQRRLTTINMVNVSSRLAVSPSDTSADDTSHGLREIASTDVPVLKPIRSLHLIRLEPITEGNDQESASVDQNSASRDQKPAPVPRKSVLFDQESSALDQKSASIITKAKSVDSDIFYDPEVDRSPSLIAKRQSVISDSDALFSTPTGSMISLDSAKAITETTV